MMPVDENPDMQDAKISKSARKKPNSLGAIIKRWGPIAAIVIAMFTAFFLDFHEYITLSNLISQREMLLSYVKSHFIASLMIYLFIYIAMVALSFPGASFITIIGGFLFGWMLGGSATIIGATVGATIIFLAARTSFGQSLHDRAGPFLAKLADGFRENAFSYLLFLRLTPIFPFWVVNLAPALFEVPLRSFVIATFLGIIPGTFAYSFVGSGLDSVIAAQEKANPGCASAGTCAINAESLITQEIVIAFIALGIVSLMPVFIKRMRKNK